MKVSELIEELKKINGDYTVNICVVDQDNGNEYGTELEYVSDPNHHNKSVTLNCDMEESDEDEEEDGE